MRKGLALLLLLLLPVWAAAEMPSGPELSIAWRGLTDAQHGLFTVLYEAIAAGKTEITFDTPADYDDVSAVMRVLWQDFPELCGLGSGWSVSYYRNSPEKALGVSVSYSYEETASRREALLAEAERMLADLPEDALSRELRIYDLLRERVTYGDGGTGAHEAAGALLEGRAVCEGYAEAMVLLCRLAGIPCSVLTGTATQQGVSERHAWVLLELDGVYTQADPTWDDTGDLPLYDFLNLSDGMLSGTHRRDGDSLLLPSCDSEELCWHTISGNLAPTGGSLRGFLHEKRQELEREGVLRLRFADEADRQTALDFFSRSLSFTWYGDESGRCLTLFAGTEEK